MKNVAACKIINKYHHNFDRKIHMPAMFSTTMDLKKV